MAEIAKILQLLLRMIGNLAKTSPFLLILIPVVLMSDKSFGIISIIVAIWLILGGNLEGIKDTVNKLAEQTDNDPDKPSVSYEKESVKANKKK